MEILGKYLDKDFRVSPMSQNKATMEEINNFEKELKELKERKEMKIKENNKNE